MPSGKRLRFPEPVDTLLKKPSIVNASFGALGAGLTVNKVGKSIRAALLMSGPGDVFDPNGAAVDTNVTVVVGGDEGGDEGA